MNQENRPNPEELLKAIKNEESAEKKGRLKIFLGMAAGVGKTYAMLEEAQKLKNENINVAIGIIETHKRKETEKLVEGLNIIPEKTVIYKDIPFKELDLDEIIRLKPEVVLVDELAHSNIPDLRHEKRWQDVIEILENGIDVYTTLNVQHIESLKDIIENITGIVINETVPDLIIEGATFIQIVDLIPDELLKRLEEGKVYTGDQSKIASQNFFKENKLTALREILLRYTAAKVDHDLNHMASIIETETKWRSREKLLVALSPSPHSQKLIRTARRIASTLEASWIAVYVDTGKTLSDDEQLILSKNITLARDLGAEVITTQDPDVADAIQRLARRRGVTQIIVGRSPPKGLFGFLNKFNLLNRLAKECTDIDIHVIRQEKLLTKNQKKLTAAFTVHHFNSYILVFIAVFLLAALNVIALPFIGHSVVAEIFLIGILALSLFFKKGPVFLASCLLGMIWYFLFIPNEIKTKPETILVLIIYILTAIATGILVDRYRDHQTMLVKREETSLALYRIIQNIATSQSTDKLFEEVDRRLEKAFNTSVEIIVKQLHNGIQFEKSSSLIYNDKEKAAALWVYENEKEAGWSTDTLPSAENFYLPLKGFHETVGILACKKRKGNFLSLDEKNFLYTVSQQLGIYIERSFLDERAKQNELLLQIEKINSSILKRIGREFTPVWVETKKSLAGFKEKLKKVDNEFLSQDFSAIEKSFNRLNETIEHISLMLDIKKE